MGWVGVRKTTAKADRGSRDRAYTTGTNSEESAVAWGAWSVKSRKPGVGEEHSEITGEENWVTWKSDLQGDQ